MWLILEKGILRHLHRRHSTEIVDPFPDEPGRRALVLEAAHTILPEAGVADLPAIARTEMESGLAGLLRQAISAIGPRQDEELISLRDQLVRRLGGRPARPGAISLADQVHLARLVRGDVPEVVAAGCLAWYGACRGHDDPHTRVVGVLQNLYDVWAQRSSDRPGIEEAMKTEARSVVGDRPGDLLDATV